MALLCQLLFLVVNFHFCYRSLIISPRGFFLITSLVNPVFFLFGYWKNAVESGFSMSRYILNDETGHSAEFFISVMVFLLLPR